MTGVAALLTCHNRRDLTIACLRSFFAQSNDRVTLCAYVVDDGSSDGTSDAIKSEFPSVHLINGNGHLFWNGGMRAAFETASKRSHDYYLWLNDDTRLFDGGLDRLIAAHQELSVARAGPTIVVGSTCSPGDPTRSTYGGWMRRHQRVGLDLTFVSPSSTQSLPCDTFNGNCVLIPRDAERIVGNLDASFTHCMGDIDYGLRAKNAGCNLWVAARHVGTCELNRYQGSWPDASIPLMARWRKLVGPKGLPPREWLTLTRRHTGLLWPLYWLNPYVKFWIRGLWPALYGHDGK